MTPKDDTLVNWRADAWFTRYHADKLSDEFKEFWISFYDTPSDYSEDIDEQHEYWIRCAFAHMGWSAANDRGFERRKSPDRRMSKNEKIADKITAIIEADSEEFRKAREYGLGAAALTAEPAKTPNA